MANKRPTAFQNLNNILFGSNSVTPDIMKLPPSMDSLASDQVLYTTNDKEDYERKLTSYRQQKLLSYQWVKAGADNAMESLAGYTAVKLMYRDADLMDGMPEIGSALDILASECCNCGSDGQMIHIKSKSKRVKSILEDLFANRLHVHIMLPLIARAMVKYGNQFMLLNVTKDNGIMGWKQLPVYEIDRIENGYTTSPAAGAVPIQTNEIRPDSTKFVWVGHNESIPYQDWQIAHFRLLNDSFFLPYGCIVGDTRIETENGFKEIDSITIGDRIWTFNVDTQKKELSTVTMGAYKGIKDVYSVKTWHNFIEGTDDHKLLCYENNKLVYKEIKEIKEGDLLIIDNSINRTNCQIKIDKSPLKNYEANFNKSTQWWDNYIGYIPDYVNTEFAKFFGFMLGDGWISGCQVSFATGEYDSFNKEFSDYLAKISGKKPDFRAPQRKMNYNVSQCRVTSKSLAVILHRMGFNGKFNEKRIPSWVYSATDEIKKAFLDGIMIADGSYHIDKYNCLRCSIEMSNEQLIKDIKVLTQSLGYKSGQISSRNRTESHLVCNRIVKSTCPSYYFYFFETQNTQEKKYEIANRLQYGFKTEIVRSKEYVGKKKTYDITVENPNSNFFANGIVTHNCSHLHKARRAWRMWSMMEDSMFLYRLDKSIQRRVFKIYVGAIDDKDVPAFVQEVANNFKRTPVVDPLTGQIDLRKNFLDVSSDYFIPVRDPGAPTPIENLPNGDNPTAMDDINYMQGKVFAALGVPKTFLNFQEAQGKGQNLSLLDIRLCRMVNRFQTFLIMELNKVAMLHLTLLGLKDEIGNFTITMNNPSAQIEALELEDMTKRIQTATAALADPGIGMPLMSLHMVLKKIMKMTDSEIKDMLSEIRLEKAMAAELAATANVIKKTGMFDSVDRIYGDYDAMNAPQQGQGQQQGQDEMGGPAGGGGMGGGFEGGSLATDSLGGGDMGGDIGGAEGTTDMGSAPDVDAGNPVNPGNPNESRANKPVINEKVKSFTERYFDLLKESQSEEDGEDADDIEGKNELINEEVDAIFDKIDKIIESNCDEDKFTLNEVNIVSDKEIEDELVNNSDE